MKKYFIIILSFIISISCFTQERSVDTLSDKIIYKDGVGKIKIGDTYDKVRKYCSKMNYKVLQIAGKYAYIPKGKIPGLHIYKDKTLLMVITNNNWGLPPYIVHNIEIFSNNLKTKEGVFVGMNFKDLHNLFPDDIVKESMMDESLYFKPKEYQTITGLNQTILLLFLNLKNKDMKSVEDLNKDLNILDGVVYSISISKL